MCHLCVCSYGETELLSPSTPAPPSSLHLDFPAEYLSACEQASKTNRVNDEFPGVCMCVCMCEKQIGATHSSESAGAFLDHLHPRASLLCPALTLKANPLSPPQTDRCGLLSPSRAFQKGFISTFISSQPALNPQRSLQTFSWTESLRNFHYLTFEAFVTAWLMCSFERIGTRPVLECHTAAQTRAHGDICRVRTEQMCAETKGTDTRREDWWRLRGEETLSLSVFVCVCVCVSMEEGCWIN